MLNITNAHKHFAIGTEEKKYVFRDFNLKINKGDFVTILGSNGAGKSTLFKLINGSIPLDKGQVYLNGIDISGRKAFDRAKDISTVVQDTKVGTLGSMTVFENLSMAEMKGKKVKVRFCLNKRSRKRYKAYLKAFNLGLENQLDSKVSVLSGGQRQVLSLLMATLTTPKLLLLDEHTAALDPETSKAILSFTHEITKNKDLSCMMITHNLEDAITFGNRLIMLHDGKLLFDIKGEEKKSLTVSALLKRYKSVDCSVTDRQLFA